MINEAFVVGREALEPSIQAGLRTNAPNFVVLTTFVLYCQCINVFFMDPKLILERLERFLGAKPVVPSDVFVAPNATLVGKVSVGSRSSVWFQSVIRADINEIRIGENTNIQDGSILHVADRYGLTIGDQVCCGHRAILHACTIGDRVLIGMGAIVLDGAEIGTGSIIGASTLITKATQIPPGSLVLGSPGEVVRKVTTGEQKGIEELAEKYVAVAKHYCRLE